MGIFYKMPHRPMLFLFLPFLVLFPFLFIHREHTLKEASELICDGEEFEIYGTLYKKEEKADSVNLYLKNLYYQKESIPGRLVVSYDSDEIPIYSKVHIYATERDFSPAENEGGFDEKNYYLSSGIIFRGKKAKVIDYKANKGLAFFENLYVLKKNMMHCYDTYLPGEESGLLRAMCLGDKTYLDTQAKTLFRDAGLSHILAVSGLHVSIVGMALFRILKRSGLGYLLSGILSSAVVLIYGLTIGFTGSSLRAVLMFLVLILSMVLGEAYDLCSSWMLAFMIVCFLEPMSASNTGFVFSFGAVFGIFSVANPLVCSYESLCKKRFENTLRFRKGRNYRKSFKETLISQMLFSVGIQLFTLPLVAYNNYVIPIYVVALNLLLIPLLSVLIGFGLLGGLFVVLSETLKGGAFFIVGRGFLFICHCILYLYEAASDFSLKLPVARITVGKPSLLMVLIYYGVLFAFVFLGKAGDVFWRKNHIKSEVGKYIRCVAILCVILICFLKYPTEKKAAVYMLSVGQGDGLCVTSEEGLVYMVDGGSSSKKNVGKYVIEPFLAYHGISKVDYWLVSHLDEDHISGLLELLETGYPIKNVVLTDSVKNLTEETAIKHYEEIMDLCKKNQTGLCYVSTGDAFGTKSLRFSCLWPTGGDESSDLTKDTNSNSMVLKLSYGDFDMCFTGDIGAQQEALLLKQYESKEELKSVEVLKGAHHGSKNSNSSEWLSFLSPRLCVLSAGKNNIYRHPASDTIERLEENGILHRCTIDCGEIMIFPKKNGSFYCRYFFCRYFLENNP